MGGHGKDDDGDAGLVDGADAGAVAAGPGAVGVLLGAEAAHDTGVPIFPLLAADLMHGVGRVVVAVVMMLAVVEVAFQVLDRLGHHLVDLGFAFLVGGVA